MKRRTLLGTIVAAPVAAALRIPTVRADVLDIVVIGAGAFGGWTALELVRRGHRVTLIDAWGPGNSRASSGGETRVIRSGYTDPFYARMARRALQLWQQNQGQFGQTLFHPTGVLFMAQRPGLEFLDTAMRNMVDADIPHEVLDRDALAERWPQINYESIERGLFEPDAGMLMARQACAVVARAFVKAGGTYIQQHVRPGPKKNGQMSAVELADGRSVTGTTFVFACGPWLKTLFPDVLGNKLAVTRQEVLYFGTPPGEGRFDQDALPVWADFGQGLWYGLPGNGRRGFKIALDTRGEPFDPTNGERIVREESIRRAERYIARRFPGLAGAPLLESRVCQYTQTGASDFVVDRHPRADNVWLVGGGSGHGFKHGPALGEHVVGRVLGEVAAEPRFALSGVG